MSDIGAAEEKLQGSYACECVCGVIFVHFQSCVQIYDSEEVVILVGSFLRVRKNATQSQMLRERCVNIRPVTEGAW